MKKWAVRDRETGAIIDTFATEAEADAALERYEVEEVEDRWTDAAIRAEIDRICDGAATHLMGFLIGKETWTSWEVRACFWPKKGAEDLLNALYQLKGDNQ